MSVKQETAQEGVKHEPVHIQSMLARMPPLIPLPRPGCWSPQANGDRDCNIDIKREESDERNVLHLTCSSCFGKVHSSMVLSCDMGHLLCVPCWSVMAMAWNHVPLIRMPRNKMDLAALVGNQLCGCAAIEI